MPTLNESFSDFLAERKNEATMEMKSNQRYAECITKQSDLRARLKSLICHEAEAILNEYMEAVLDGQVMTENRILVCGMTTVVGIQKRLDTSAPEYQEFLKEFL